MEKNKLKIAIAMSGGVDSSVAAKILKDQGHDIVGVFFVNQKNDLGISNFKILNPKQILNSKLKKYPNLLDAHRVAEKLNIPLYVADVSDKFKKDVIEYFLNEYKNLRTPNPCVVCNEKIKFGWLLDFAKKIGCQYLATGHYARIAVSNSGDTKLKILNSKQILSSNFQNNKDCHPVLDAGSRNYCIDSGSQITDRNDNDIYHLLKGKDEKKDQSYFLYRLNQKQLSKTIFPLGEYTKDEVKATAKKWKLPVFEKRDSQEICFVADKDINDYLRRDIPVHYFKPGDIVDKEGNILGKHKGLINYTIGQRRGIDQNTEYRIQNTEGKQPLYVIGFDKKKNQLVVGEDSEIYQNEMFVEDVHFVQHVACSIQNSANLKVKIRYRHPAVPCTVKILDTKDQMPNSVKVDFDEAQRAITPGQSALFYDGDEVIGGGSIQ